MTIIVEQTGLMCRRRITDVESVEVIFKQTSPVVAELSKFFRLNSGSKAEDIRADTVISMEVIP